MRRAHISVRVVIRRGQRRDVNDFTQRLCGGGGGGGRVAELELEELVEVEGMGVGMGVGVGVRVRKKELLWRSFDWFFIFFFISLIRRWCVNVIFVGHACVALLCYMILLSPLFLFLMLSTSYVFFFISYPSSSFNVPCHSLPSLCSLHTHIYTHIHTYTLSFSFHFLPSFIFTTVVIKVVNPRE